MVQKITLSTKTNLNFENTNYVLLINMTHSGLLTQIKQQNYSKLKRTYSSHGTLKTHLLTRIKTDKNFRIKNTLLTLNI